MVGGINLEEARIYAKQFEDFKQKNIAKTGNNITLLVQNSKAELTPKIIQVFGEVDSQKGFDFGGWIERNNKKAEGQHSGDRQPGTQMDGTMEDSIEVAVDLKCCQLFVRLVLLDRYVLQHSARIST